MPYSPRFYRLGQQHSSVTTTTVLTSGTDTGYSKEFVRDANYILGWKAPDGTGDVWVGYDFGAAYAIRDFVIGYDPRNGSPQSAVKVQYADDAAFTVNLVSLSVNLGNAPYSSGGPPLGIVRGSLAGTITKRYWRLVCHYTGRSSNSLTPKITFFGLYNNTTASRWTYDDLGYSQPIEPGELTTIIPGAQDETMAGVPVVNVYGGARPEFEVALRATNITAAGLIQAWADNISRRATHVEFDGIYPNFLDMGGSGSDYNYGAFARLVEDSLKFYRYHTGLYDVSFRMRGEPWL